MAALQFVIKLIESENRFEVPQVLDQIDELDEWLADSLEKRDILSL